MSSPSQPVALDELLRHAGWVRGLARSLVRDDATADDAVQDTWAAAVKSPPHDASTARAWLAVTVRNAVRSRGRAESRRARREEAAARPEAVHATVDVAARGEQHRRVVTAVMALDEPYRGTVLLRFFEELPPREVAARMEVPVETVRTRTRRALALLRTRLDDEEGGDRRRWIAALAPLVRIPCDGASVATRSTRRSRMFTPKLLAAVAVLALSPVVWLFARDTAPPAGPPSPPDATARADDPGPRPPRRHADAASPAAPSPGDEREDDGPAGDAKPAADADTADGDGDASVYADGVLAVTLAVEPATPRAKQPFDVVATFRNTGTGPLRFHVPEHAGLVPFPDLELRGGDGKRFAVISPSFQSMWQRGLQGTLVRLEPGGTHEVRTRVSAVTPLADDAPRTNRGRALSQRSLELPPGDYVLDAVLTKERPVVPWGGDMPEVTEKPVAGLWTGELTAPAIAFRLAAPDEPILILTGPAAIRPGSAQEFTLEVVNASKREQVLRGPFALRRSEKGGPGMTAWFTFGERGARAAAGASAELRLAPGDTRSCTLDAGALEWVVAQPRPGEYAPLPWPHFRNYAAVWVTCGERVADGDGMLGSNTVLLAFEPAPDLAPRGLACEFDTTDLSTPTPHVTVRLRNVGSTPVRVRRDLARRVVLTVEERGVSGRVIVPLPSGVASDDAVTLETGQSMEARLDLPATWHDSLAAGRHPLVARWAEVDGGAGGDITVGRVVSEPVEVVVSGD